MAIATQNMTLMAKSLGLGSCYIGFATQVNKSEDLLDRLGIREPFRISTALALGYPRFKQEGLVPREFRPLIWVRQGDSGPEIEE